MINLSFDRTRTFRTEICKSPFDLKLWLTSSRVWKASTLPSDPKWLHWNNPYMQEFMFAFTGTQFEEEPRYRSEELCLHSCVMVMWSDRGLVAAAHAEEGKDWRQTCGCQNAELWKFLTLNLTQIPSLYKWVEGNHLQRQLIVINVSVCLYSIPNVKQHVLDEIFYQNFWDAATWSQWYGEVYLYFTYR